MDFGENVKDDKESTVHESRKRKSTGRRSSILKVGGQSPTRTALIDINPNSQVERDVPSKKTCHSRRVSFASTYQVKEFTNHSWDSLHHHDGTHDHTTSNMSNIQSELPSMAPADLQSLLTGPMSADMATRNNQLQEVSQPNTSNEVWNGGGERGLNVTVMDGAGMEMTEMLGHISKLDTHSNQEGVKSGVFADSVITNQNRNFPEMAKSDHTILYNQTGDAGMDFTQCQDGDFSFFLQGQQSSVSSQDLLNKDGNHENRLPAQLHIPPRHYSKDDQLYHGVYALNNQTDYNTLVNTSLNKYRGSPTSVSGIQDKCNVQGQSSKSSQKPENNCHGNKKSTDVDKENELLVSTVASDQFRRNLPDDGPVQRVDSKNFLKNLFGESTTKKSVFDSETQVEAGGNESSEKIDSKNFLQSLIMAKSSTFSKSSDQDFVFNPKLESSSLPFVVSDTNTRKSDYVNETKYYGSSDETAALELTTCNGGLQSYYLGGPDHRTGQSDRTVIYPRTAETGDMEMTTCIGGLQGNETMKYMRGNDNSTSLLKRNNSSLPDSAVDKDLTLSSRENVAPSFSHLMQQNSSRLSVESSGKFPVSINSGCTFSQVTPGALPSSSASSREGKRASPSLCQAANEDDVETNKSKADLSTAADKQRRHLADITRTFQPDEPTAKMELTKCLGSFNIMQDVPQDQDDEIQFKVNPATEQTVQFAHGEDMEFTRCMNDTKFQSMFQVADKTEDLLGHLPCEVPAIVYTQQQLLHEVPPSVKSGQMQNVRCTQEQNQDSVLYGKTPAQHCKAVTSSYEQKESTTKTNFTETKPDDFDKTHIFSSDKTCAMEFTTCLPPQIHVSGEIHDSDKENVQQHIKESQQSRVDRTVLMDLTCVNAENTKNEHMKTQADMTKVFTSEKTAALDFTSCVGGLSFAAPVATNKNRMDDDVSPNKTCIFDGGNTECMELTACLDVKTQDLASISELISPDELRNHKRVSEADADRPRIEAVQSATSSGTFNETEVIDVTKPDHRLPPSENTADKTRWFSSENTACMELTACHDGGLKPSTPQFPVPTDHFQLADKTMDKTKIFHSEQTAAMEFTCVNEAPPISISAPCVASKDELKAKQPTWPSELAEVSTETERSAATNSVLKDSLLTGVGSTKMPSTFFKKSENLPLLSTSLQLGSLSANKNRVFKETKSDLNLTDISGRRLGRGDFNTTSTKFDPVFPGSSLQVEQQCGIKPVLDSMPQVIDSSSLPENSEQGKLGKKSSEYTSLTEKNCNIDIGKNSVLDENQEQSVDKHAQLMSNAEEKNLTEQFMSKSDIVTGCGQGPLEITDGIEKRQPTFGKTLQMSEKAGENFGDSSSAEHVPVGGAEEIHSERLQSDEEDSDPEISFKSDTRTRHKTVSDVREATVKTADSSAEYQELRKSDFQTEVEICRESESVTVEDEQMKGIDETDNQTQAASSSKQAAAISTNTSISSTRNMSNISDAEKVKVGILQRCPPLDPSILSCDQDFDLLDDEVMNLVDSKLHFSLASLHGTSHMSLHDQSRDMSIRKKESAHSDIRKSDIGTSLLSTTVTNAHCSSVGMEESHMSKSLMSMKDSISGLQIDGASTIHEFLTEVDSLFLNFNTRRSTTAPMSVAPPETFAEKLEQAITVPPELHTYEWVHQWMDNYIEEVKKATKTAEAKLIANPPAIFTENIGISKQQLESTMKKEKQICRKTARCKFKQWRKKMVNTIVNGYKDEVEFVNSGIAEMERSVVKLDEGLASLAQADEELDAKLSELGELPDIPQDDLQLLEKLQNELNEKQSKFEKVQSEEKKLDNIRSRFILENDSNLQELRETEKVMAKLCEELEVEHGTHDLITELNQLQSYMEWSIVQLDNNTGHFSFLYNSLSLHLVFENPKMENIESNQGKPTQIIKDLDMLSHLSDEASCCAKFTHALISTAADKQRLLKRCHSLPQLLGEMNAVVSWARALGRDVEDSSLLHNVSIDDTRVTVGFSSLEAFAKFDLIIDIQASKYPDHGIEWSYKSHIGSVREEDVRSELNTVEPGASYYSCLIAAADNLLKRHANKKVKV